MALDDYIYLCVTHIRRLSCVYESAIVECTRYSFHIPPSSHLLSKRLYYVLALGALPLDFLPFRVTYVYTNY